MLQFGGQRGGRHGGEQGGRHDGRHVGEQVGRHVMLQFDERVGQGGCLIVANFLDLKLTWLAHLLSFASLF